MIQYPEETRQADIAKTTKKVCGIDINQADQDCPEFFGGPIQADPGGAPTLYPGAEVITHGPVRSQLDRRCLPRTYILVKKDAACTPIAEQCACPCEMLPYLFMDSTHAMWVRW